MVAVATAIQGELLVVVDAVVIPGPALEFAELAGAQSVVLDDDWSHVSPVRVPPPLRAETTD